MAAEQPNFESVYRVSHIWAHLTDPMSDLSGTFRLINPNIIKMIHEGQIKRIVFAGAPGTGKTQASLGLADILTTKGIPWEYRSHETALARSEGKPEQYDEVAREIIGLESPAVTQIAEFPLVGIHSRGASVFAEVLEREKAEGKDETMFLLFLQTDRLRIITKNVRAGLANLKPEELLPYLNTHGMNITSYAGEIDYSDLARIHAFLSSQATPREMKDVTREMIVELMYSTPQEKSDIILGETDSDSYWKDLPEGDQRFVNFSLRYWQMQMKRIGIPEHRFKYVFNRPLAGKISIPAELLLRTIDFYENGRSYEEK